MNSAKKSAGSVFGGACIVACVCVGAGMLALPSSGAGAWLIYSAVIIVLTMLMMTLSGWMLLMVYQHYDYHASFNTVTQDLLGPVASVINNLAVYFVGAVLLYAYTTEMGGILGSLLHIYNELAALLAVLVFSGFVWWSTRAVDRLSVLLLLTMALTFIFSISGLARNIELPTLFDLGNSNAHYAKYALALFPVALVSFGYHHSVTSLRDYYKSERRAKYAILGGTLIATVLYLIWIVCVFGNLPREDFGPVLEADGNVVVLLQTLTAPVHKDSVQVLLKAFSTAAMVSSFVGVGLGLFDYLADLFGIQKTRRGRSIVWGLTFLPPLILSMIAPSGFVLVIGYAGAIATIWTCIIPGLLAIRSRKKHRATIQSKEDDAGQTLRAPVQSNPWEIKGARVLAPLLLVFGVFVAVIHMLDQWHYLPSFMP